MWTLLALAIAANLLVVFTGGGSVGWGICGTAGVWVELDRGGHVVELPGVAYLLGAVMLMPLLIGQPLGWVATPSGAGVVIYLGLVTMGIANVSDRLLAFFLKAGSLTFGSGLVIVPFLENGLVRQTGWLDERQFLVAVAMGMLSPGPVVITATFVGYLVAMAFFPWSWGTAIAGFLLFRLFDVAKPWPASAFDRVKSGFGVVMDDVAAGVYAGLALAFYLTGRLVIWLPSGGIYPTSQLFSQIYSPALNASEFGLLTTIGLADMSGWKWLCIVTGTGATSMCTFSSFIASATRSPTPSAVP